MQRDDTTGDAAAAPRADGEGQRDAALEQLPLGFARFRQEPAQGGSQDDFVLLEVNAAFERLTGLRRQDAVARRLNEVLPLLQGRAEEWSDAFERVVRTGEEARFEQRLGAAQRWLAVTAYRPSPGQVACVVQDLGGHQRAPAPLREPEGLLRMVFDNLVDSVWVLGPDFKVLYVNAGAVRESGYSYEELREAVVLRHLSVEGRERNRAALERVANGGGPQSLDLELRRKDGSYFSAEVTISACRDAQGRPVAYVHAARDVTARRRAEQALRDSEERFRAVLKNCSVVVGFNDEQLRYTWIYNLPGFFTGGDVIGKCDLEFGPEAVWRHLYELKRAALQTGEGQQRTVHFELPGGDRVFEVSSEPYRDNAGRVLGVATVGLDVTDRVRATEKLRSTEAQLRQAQKLEAIGRLAGGVAHDFNNQLSIIYSCCALLLRRLEPGDPRRGEVDEILRAAEHSATLTRQLLAFSRKQMLQPVLLDPSVLVGEIEKMLRRLIGEDVELITDLAPALGRIKVDPGQLEQVLINLVVNARDAMPGGGRVVVQTRAASLQAAAAREVGVPPGEYVVLSVEDNGCGMDAETRARIFEPFFTTKDEGRGTGLGLSTVYGIVTQSGGGIAVTSAPGRGSRFSVYLPQEQEAPAMAPAASATPVPRGRERVLLVEDEPRLRSKLLRLLMEAGYQVLEAGDPLEAEVRHGAEPFDLLLTDVVMPRMSGTELARRLQARRPGLKVLFMSGYTDSALARHNVPGASLLSKPFEPAALARAVRRALDAA